MSVEPYPKDILQLNSTGGFIRAVWARQQGGVSCITAYEAVEEMHETYYGQRRYVDYQNFIKARSKYLRRMK